MNRSVFSKIFLFLVSCVFVPLAGISQITSSADAVIPTEYSSGTQDNIYVFCSQKDVSVGTLTATFPNGESGTVEWTKYNVSSGNFDFFSSDASGGTSSTISNLADGGYRATLTSNAGTYVYTAWVFNDYIVAAAEIPESDCSSFKLDGSFDSPVFSYTDLSNGQTVVINKGYQENWMIGEDVVGHVLSFTNYDPPTRDTKYTFEVTDKFTCAGQTEITYTSIVTKASFTYVLQDQKSDSKKTEAPLTVTFTNTSENGDPGQFEWFISKDLYKITLEQQAGTFKDSTMDVLYNDSPVYTFENVGEYKVKLVSKHITENTTCTDTFYMAETIKVDSSFVDAPNVVLPDNGDEKLSVFAVKFFSMKSIKITILNRWGKVLHVWQSGNVQGFFNTATSIRQSVWDCKVNGRVVSPGVYYYVADGVGRDGQRRRASGFFHIFRGK